MALNPGIIMSGQLANPVNAMAQGAAAGQQINDNRYTNAMRDMFKQNGAGILAGDQNAMNAMAQFDPSAAQGIQSGRINQQATREQMAQRRASEARQVTQAAANATAAERAEIAQRIESAVAMGLQAQTPEQWDRLMTERSPDLVGMFSERQIIAAEYMSVADSVKRMDAANAVPEAPTDPAAIQSLKFRAQAAGLQEGTPEYQQFMLNAGVPKAGTSMTVGADGTVRFNQGGPVGGEDGRMSPSAPATMIDSIDGILNDPALDTATGWLAFTQNIPGTPQYRFGTRSKQIEGQAFLQAFESLKGAGQITEVEGIKATQAIGRLDTSQSPADYREALTDLKRLLTLAQGRAGGAQAAPAAADLTGMSDADLEAIINGG